MTDFYDDAAAMAGELLAEFGQSCVLTVIGEAVYDPNTGETTAPDPVAHPVTAALFDYPLRHIDGTLILTGDKKALVSPVGLTAEPKPGHMLTDTAGAIYTVVNAKATAPAGVAVLWTLQVRK